jgi:DNA-binding beta-propeller fold protein YncE
MIALQAPALRLALGNDGNVFATRDYLNGWVGRPITIIDGPGATVKTTVEGDYDRLIAFDRPGNHLITGAAGSSASTLTRYAFDPMALTLTYEQERWDSGDNARDIAISPDGDHIAFACAAGNGAGYSIFDFDSNDFDTTFGDWLTMPYPTAAAFTSDGKKLVASNSDDILVFDTKTHALLHSDTPMNLGGCGYQNIDRVSASPAGGIYYAISKCGIKKDSGMLFWFVP